MGVGTIATSSKLNAFDNGYENQTFTLQEGEDNGVNALSPSYRYKPENRRGNSMGKG